MEEQSLRVIVGTAPHGTRLDTEIQLIKPALLYGDEVVLYSPGATLLAGISGLGDATLEQRLQLLEHVAPVLDPSGQTAQTVQLFRELKRKKHRTRHELLAVIRMEKALDEAWKKFPGAIDQLLEEAGAPELTAPIQEGLLRIDPLLEEGDDQNVDHVLIERFVQRITEAFAAGVAYPLFDDQTGELIRAGVREGRFVPNASSTERGKQMGAVARLLKYLPNFPRASVNEVLAVRDELRDPLVRFRAAVVEMGRAMRPAAYDEEFPHEVEMLFRERVAPALADIEDRVRSNSYLRQLAGVLARDPKPFVSALLALVLASTGTLPALIAAAAGASAPIAQAAWKQRLEAEEIGRDQMYFLYRTEDLLQEP